MCVYLHRSEDATTSEVFCGAVLKATNYTNFHELKIFLFPYSIDYQDKTISVN